MGKNIEEYKRYMKKQEMLGMETFKFKIDEEKDEVYITSYIINNESHRMINIPDFVCEGCIGDTHQNIHIVGGQNLRYLIIKNFNGNKIDVSSVNTRNITDMHEMFVRCVNLKELDLSNFDTRNVKRMNYMFGSCLNLKEVNLSNFDTSNVADMGWMFRDCLNLKELDLSNFDTGNVTDMGWMFCGCERLEELDLSNFNTSSVDCTDYMFASCDKLRTIITNKETKQWLETNRKVISLNRKCKVIVK